MRFEGPNGETLRELVSGRIHELRLIDVLHPDNGSEIKDLERIANIINDTFDLNEGLLYSKNPQEDLQRYIEIIIQKDNEWIVTEMEEDSRMAFFFFYFLQKKSDEKMLTFEEVYQELRSKRFDANFVNEVVSSLKGVHDKMDYHLLEMSKQLGIAHGRMETRNQYFEGTAESIVRENGKKKQIYGKNMMQRLI